MTNEITSDQLIVGMRVSINPQNDRTRKKLVDGVIKEILTKSPSHPHGILVKLDSDETGRVKEILDYVEFTQPHNDNLNAENKLERLKSLDEMIMNGENHFLEFKTSILWSKYKTKEEIQGSKSYELKKYGQNTSKYIIAKSLCGFLNADGGTLIVGVKEFKDTDKTEAVGIDSE